MGQPQSLPVPAAPPVEIKVPDTPKSIHHQVNDKDKLKTNKINNSKKEPLEKWTNDDRYSFEVISPLSDISNPSQFRHRIRNTTSKVPDCDINQKNALANSGRIQTTRSRTSKVCSKDNPELNKKYRRRSDHGQDCIPPPASFYFQPETEPICESLEFEIEVIQDDALKINTINDNALVENKNAQDRPLTTSWKLKCLIWKAKCQKTKERFSECWSSSENKEIKLQKTTDEQESLSPRNNDEIVGFEQTKLLQASQSCAYLQLEHPNFQPVWKENGVDTTQANMPINGYNNTYSKKINKVEEKVKVNSVKHYYLHSEDEYVKRIAGKAPNSSEKEKQENVTVENNMVECDNAHIQALFDGDDGTRIDLVTGKDVVRKSSSPNIDVQAFSVAVNTTVNDDVKGKRVKKFVSNNLVAYNMNTKPVAPDKEAVFEKLTKQILHDNDDVNTSQQPYDEPKTQSRQVEAVPQQLIASHGAFTSKGKDSVTESNLNVPRNSILLNTVDFLEPISVQHTPTQQSSCNNQSFVPILSETNLSDNESQRYESKESAIVTAKKSNTRSSICRQNDGADPCKQIFLSDKATIKSPAKHPSLPLPSSRPISFRHSHPPDNYRRSYKTSMASLLQQTYLSKSILHEESVSSDDEQNESSVGLSAVDYRQIIWKQNSRPQKKAGKILEIVPSSPSMSVDSMSSKPMVSDQAMNNAAFLFSPSYVGGDLSRIRRASSGTYSTAESTGLSVSTLGFSISTFGSRNRVSSALSKSIKIPMYSASSLESKKSGKSNRRVKFSDVGLPKNNIDRHTISSIIVPEIESKYTDLTDDNDTVSKIGTPEEIPGIEYSLTDLTDDANPASESESVPSVPMVSAIMYSPRKELFSEPQKSYLSTPIQNEKFVVMSTSEDMSHKIPKTEGKMRWSYHENGSSIPAVTPLIVGKTTLHQHTTNSPFLRFEAARSKFGGGSRTANRTKEESLLCNHAAHQIQKASPIKRRQSPITKKSGSIVNARIAAMEALHRHQKDEDSRMSSSHATSLNFSKCSRTSSLSSSRFSSSSFRSNAQQEYVESAFQPNSREKRSLSTSSSMTAASQDYTKLDVRLSGTTQSLLQDTDDALLQNQLQTTRCSSISQGQGGGDSKDTESECDLFDEFLNEDHSDGESNFESVIEGGSIATIRQDRTKPTAVDHRYSSQSNEDASTVLTSSTYNEVASVATIRQVRNSLATSSENSSWSATSRFQHASLPFRQESHVKPIELNIAAPSVSMTQNIPSQPRKWRALAAAAVEKDSKRNVASTKQNNFLNNRRSSLSELNPNTLYL